MDKTLFTRSIEYYFCFLYKRESISCFIHYMYLQIWKSTHTSSAVTWTVFTTIRKYYNKQQQKRWSLWSFKIVPQSNNTPFRE